MKWLWRWIGGSIGRVAGAGIFTGLFIVLYGITPSQFFAEKLADLPTWLLNPWFKVALVIVGLVIIWVSFLFNVWSLRQVSIDELAEELSWAIHHLLNRSVGSNTDLVDWEENFRSWCRRVSVKLENRAFFTRADQLHFDRLGLVPPANFAGSFNQRHEWLVSQLSLKFDRLRDVINWTQMRKR
jgi:hypothetical protein